MKLIIQLIGILLILVGIFFLSDPEALFDWIENSKQDTWLYISAIVTRLVLGILFIMAAKESKFPAAIKFIGYLLIVFVIIFILIGHNGFQDFVSYLIPTFKPYAPVSSLFAMAFGGFLVYAFTKRKGSMQESN